MIDDNERSLWGLMKTWNEEKCLFKVMSSNSFTQPVSKQTIKTIRSKTQNFIDSISLTNSRQTCPQYFTPISQKAMKKFLEAVDQSVGTQNYLHFSENPFPCRRRW